MKILEIREQRRVNFEGCFWKSGGEGAGSHGKSFCGGGMDIFWNHTMYIKKVLRFCATAVVCIFVLKVYERYFYF